MRAQLTKVALMGAAASLLMGSLAGCSAADSGAESGGKIAFLMPDRASTRYEEQDSPLFKKKVAELCENCEVLYQNADGDAAKQQQQVESMIAQGVDVIVIDAVDTTAAASSVQSAQASDIKVVTYDRPVPSVPADFYVSFDNKEIGSLIAQSLVDHLTEQGITDGNLLMVNGSPSDDAAMLIKEGSVEVVEDSGFTVLASYDTPDWVPQKAQDWVSGQISQFRDQIDGVVAANDGTAGGTIAAFKAAGIGDVPPVTGNDAEVAAIQRVIAGDQYNTISKPISIVAEKAAEVAVGYINGEEPKADAELFETPSALFVPEVVTAENVKEVIFDGGIYTAEEVCTDEYADACTELGIE
ncbi:ABC transporter substrate-binding protein [Paramicrobacterium agarici]|uniref:Monosaccharide ABC transporter substrate-binding protein (CUT2 family) n=1 Tax=Paramicrobacterium agarici TaxID=630514 RepID=A0A2A9DVC9_9MICO|nr:sugar ABC transporter substrate-binding protein [Microbacterium agarici]PFG29942.1 monosaccharide ABC transporter substrate-binding protein (CUT2 family) [Microbacterium agarici]TQO22935.1 monosaccharide ABC transporter substrate-binding protein (CUT2 family) [Microbacterium agarici]